MPSQTHELYIDLFRERPAFAADLLESLGFPIPAFDRAVAAPADLTDVVPTEYRADQVVKLTVDDRDVFAVIIEVQLRADKRKRFSWPAYVGTLYGRMECPVALLVVCLDAKVAEWCARPVVIADPTFFTMRPFVMGPRQVPVVTDPDQPGITPELALMSALAHYDGPHGAEVVEALLIVIGRTDGPDGNRYHDSALALLPAAALALMEELMTTTSHRYRSDFARRYFDEGEAKGEARGLLTVLEARGIEVSDDARARIAECTDMDQLDLWVRRAVTAAKAEDLFE